MVQGRGVLHRGRQVLGFAADGDVTAYLVVWHAASVAVAGEVTYPLQAYAALRVLAACAATVTWWANGHVGARYRAMPRMWSA